MSNTAFLDKPIQFPPNSDCFYSIVQNFIMATNDKKLSEEKMAELQVQSYQKQGLQGIFSPGSV